MANKIYDNKNGVMGDGFQVGGPSGNMAKNVNDGLAARSSDDDAYVNMSVKPASGNSDNHALTWRDHRDGDPLIQFSFDGSSPPSPGDHTGAYGFCHTSGGAYSAGQIYYDTGAAIVTVKVFVGMKIATGSAVTGTVSLNANGIYVAHSGSAPFTWTLKGDGAPAMSGISRMIKLAIDTSAEKLSTTAIPAGSTILDVSTDIRTPYDNDATIAVIIDGAVSDLTLQSTSENDPGVAALYISEPLNPLVDADSEGLVKVTITNAPSTGSGYVLINYTTDFLS